MSDVDDLQNEENLQFKKLIEEYLEKRIEQHKNSLELKQIVKRIYFLKKKFRNNETEEFDLEKGKVKLKKYISKFSSVGVTLVYLLVLFLFLVSGLVV